MRASARAYRAPNDVSEAGRVLRQEVEKYVARSRGTQRFKSTNLLDFIHEVSPHLDRPIWFKSYCDTIQDAPGKGLRSTFHGPPQHGKTFCTEHAFLWWDLVCPGRHHAYVTFNGLLAKEKALEFRELAARAGFEPKGNLSRIFLKNGSVVRFSSIGGTLTGQKVDGVLVVDDPHKDYAAAHSVAERAAVINWWNTVPFIRQHPGTSFIVMATRWHPKDLTGYLIERGWQYICIKAIADGEVNDNDVVIDDPLGRKLGAPLWRDMDFYDQIQVNEPPEVWSAMFQGEPVAEGNRKFREPGDIDSDGKPVGPRWYSQLPTGGYSVAFGVDLAYTEKKDADWSVLVEAWMHQGDLYIIDVRRGKMTAERFAEILLEKQRTRPRAKFRWYASTTERGMAALFRSRQFGIQGFKALPAKGDKLVRAIPVSVAWNSGKVLLPDIAVFDAPWLKPFLDVVCNFTGSGDAEDDDVDALAAVYDELNPHRGGMLAALRR